MLLLSPFYKWKNGATKRLSHLPKVTQLMNVVCLWTQISVCSGNVLLTIKFASHSALSYIYWLYIALS